MVSIIIRALNEAKYLDECLEAITKQKISEPYEIILVDSGSGDDTIKIAKSYDLNIVHIKKKILFWAIAQCWLWYQQGSNLCFYISSLHTNVTGMVSEARATS